MAMAIAGPIFVVCMIAVLIAFYLWQKKNNAKLFQHQKQPLMEKYPMGHPDIDVSGPGLKDLIDMTTSGSGSGKTHEVLSRTKTFNRYILMISVTVRRTIQKQTNITQKTMFENTHTHTFMFYCLTSQVFQ